MSGEVVDLNFEFELNNIQLYFLILLVGILTYLIIKLGTIFWPERRMPRIQRKCLRPRCLADPLVRQRRTEALAARRMTALPAERTKEWHSTISSESRHRIVRKLIRSTFSTSSSHRSSKPLYSPMITFIRMLEASLFKTANSKPEYFQMISEKMHLIRKELQQQRLRRRKQLQFLCLQHEPQMVLNPEMLNFERLSLNDHHTVVNMPEEEKKWHESFPCRSRSYMVDELMMAMLPRPDFPFPMEWDAKHMVDHARDVAKQIEGDNFQAANSKGEYYRMMGEKIVAKNKYRSETEEQMKKELHMVVVPPDQKDPKIEEI